MVWNLILSTKSFQLCFSSLILPFSSHHFSLLTTELSHAGAYTSGGVRGLLDMSATNLELYNQLNYHLESGPLALSKRDA